MVPHPILISVVFNWGLQIQLQSSSILYEKHLPFTFVLIIFSKFGFKHVLGHLSDPISTWDFGVLLVLVLTTADHPQYFTFSVSFLTHVLRSLSFQFFKFKKHCSIWATPYGCANSSKHKNTGQVYLNEFLQSLPIYHGFHPWDCVFPKRFFCLILTKVM